MQASEEKLRNVRARKINLSSGSLQWTDKNTRQFESNPLLNVQQTAVTAEAKK